MGWSLLVLLLAVLMVFAVEYRSSKRTTCRVCRTPIKNGGVGVAWAGVGFCSSCAIALMKRLR